MNKIQIDEKLAGIKSSSLNEGLKDEIHDFFYKIFNNAKNKPQFSAEEWVNLKNIQKAELFDERSNKLKEWKDVVKVSKFSNKGIKKFIQNSLSEYSNLYALRRDHYIF